MIDNPHHLDKEKLMTEFRFLDACILTLVTSWKNRNYDSHLAARIQLLTRALELYWDNKKHLEGYRRRIMICAFNKRQKMVVAQVLAIIDNRLATIKEEESA